MKNSMSEDGQLNAFVKCLMAFAPASCGVSELQRNEWMNVAPVGLSIWVKTNSASKESWRWYFSTFIRRFIAVSVV